MPPLRTFLDGNLPDFSGSIWGSSQDPHGDGGAIAPRIIGKNLATAPFHVKISQNAIQRYQTDESEAQRIVMMV
jgi:hypothetical protein